MNGSDRITITRDGHVLIREFAGEKIRRAGSIYVIADRQVYVKEEGANSKLRAIGVLGSFSVPYSLLFMEWLNGVPKGTDLLVFLEVETKRLFAITVRDARALARLYTRDFGARKGVNEKKIYIPLEEMAHCNYRAA